jgi:predicted CoA-binding protein
MTSKTLVDDFISQRTLAIVGMSRNPQKFGNAVFRELTQKGYKLFPVHPEAKELEGTVTYPSLSALPEPVGGVIIVVPPAQTEQVVKDAAAAGIKRVWMQQGAESPAAIQFCQENGIQEVHGECILMFAGQAKFHGWHRWIWGILGKLPKN